MGDLCKHAVAGDCHLCAADLYRAEVADLRAQLDDLRAKLEAVRDALDSAHTTMCADARDWSTDRRDAWLYGLVVGWDGPAMREVSKRHRFDAARLSQLHAAVAALHLDGSPPTGGRWVSDEELRELVERGVREGDGGLDGEPWLNDEFVAAAVARVLADVKEGK